MSDKVYSVADRAWQIVAGCTPNIACQPRCWATRVVNRLAQSPDPKIAEFHAGLVTRITSRDSERGAVEALRWTGEVRLNETHLLDPLRRRKPTTYAVGFHGDLFRLPAEQIDRALAVMALCPQHRFLLLSKAAPEWRSYYDRLQKMADDWAPSTKSGKFTPADVLNFRWMHETFGRGPAFPYSPWPLPHVWLGTSASNQAEADARIPVLLQVPAAHRFVFLEPLIGAVDLTRWVGGQDEDGACIRCGCTWEEDVTHECPAGFGPRLSWVIVGGESGRDARDASLDDYQRIVDQCEAAGVPCMVKQITRGGKRLPIEYWPPLLRVQQIPEALCLS